MAASSSTCSSSLSLSRPLFAGGVSIFGKRSFRNPLADTDFIHSLMSMMEATGIQVPAMNENVIQCPACQSRFPIEENGVPSRDYYIHCLFKCPEYVSKGLSKSCTSCNIFFLDQEELDQHQQVCPSVDMETSSQEQESSDEELLPTQCEYCFIAFKDEATMSYHVRAVHRSITCPKCSKLFPTNDTTSGHCHKFLNHSHYKEKYMEVLPAAPLDLDDVPYFVRKKCRICTVSLGNCPRSKKEEHFERHIGYVYRCKLCDQNSGTRKCYRKHMKRSHPGKDVTVPKPVWFLKKQDL